MVVWPWSGPSIDDPASQTGYNSRLPPRQEWQVARRSGVKNPGNMRLALPPSSSGFFTEFTLSEAEGLRMTHPIFNYSICKSAIHRHPERSEEPAHLSSFFLWNTRGLRLLRPSKKSLSAIPALKNPGMASGTRRQPFQGWIGAVNCVCPVIYVSDGISVGLHCSAAGRCFAAVAM